MIGPPATAYLLTDDLRRMLGLSMAIGAASAVGGYWIAHWLDASIAGAMASTIGAVFALVLLLAPGRGVVAAARRQQRQRVDFAQTMLAIHILNHQGTAEAMLENRVDGIDQHLHWDREFTNRIVALAQRRGIVREEGGLLSLTDAGRDLARAAIERPR
jgi:manganese/zinc/iron transport system permease protein